MDMKRGDTPECPQCDNSDVMFPYQEAIADGFLKVDSLATKAMRGGDIIAPPDSSIRYFIGTDFGVGGAMASVTMAQFYPDGYWPPVNTVEEWADYGWQRRVHRVERGGFWKDMPARYQRVLLALVIFLTFWVVYGADKVLG
jgi:hypothetical protein